MEKHPPPPGVIPVKTPLTFDQMDTEARMQHLNGLTQNLVKAVDALNAVSEAFQRHDHLNHQIVFYPPKAK